MVAHNAPSTHIALQIDMQELPFGDFSDAIPLNRGALPMLPLWIRFYRWSLNQ
jgi:hypothetical protein